MQTERLSQIAVIFIGAAVLLTVLNMAEEIAAPVALAMVAGVVLSPVSEFWERHGFPSVVGALASLAFTLALVAGLALVLQPIVAQLVDQAPKVWSDMQDTIEVMRGLATGFSEMTEGVTAAIAPEAHAQVAAELPPEDAVELPTVTDALLLAPTIVAQIFVFAGALFFFLLSRKEIYDWAARRLSEPSDRVQTARRLRAAERRVASYFLTITLINAGLGLITAGVLHSLGLPGALMWGIVAFLLNYVLYLGPAIFAVSLLYAGIAAFDGLYAALPAAAYVTLNAAEGQFLTPALVGRYMSVNPLLVFLSLVVGLWLWGPIGGIVAIPLMLWILVLNDDLAGQSEPSVRRAAA